MRSEATGVAKGSVKALDDMDVLGDCRNRNIYYGINLIIEL